MSTDNFKRVLFNDGEGVTHGDLNDAQTFLETRLSDQILHSLIGNVSLSATDPEFGGKNGANAPVHLAYCLHGGSAYLRQGSGNAKLQISPGVLMQKTGSMDGSTPTLLAYTFAGTEEVTITNGDASHPRVDLLQMKLELVDADTQSRDFEDATTHVVTTTTPNKKKRVQCTLSVKQGVAGVSPTYPDPDSGYVCIAGVVVGTLYVAAAGLNFGNDATGAVAVVHDQRMPLNVQAYFSEPVTAKCITAFSASAWAISNSNGTNDARFLCPKAGRANRIVGIGFSIDGDVAPGKLLLTQNTTKDGSSAQDRNVVDSSSNGTPVAVIVPYYTIEANHQPQAGPTVLPSATYEIGCPLWTSGFRCAVPAASGSSVCLKIQNISNPSTVFSVVWYIAQGI